MRNSAKVLVAASVVAMMGAGIGATSAGLSDSLTLTGQDIISGNLDVEAVGDMQWRDITPGRAAHDIDSLAGWRIVPGDVIQGTQAVSLGMSGDNLVAALNVGSGPLSGNLQAPSQGVKVTVDVLDADGNPLYLNQPLPTSLDLHVQASSYNQGGGTDDPGIPVIVATEASADDGTPEFYVRLTATFDQNTPNRVRTQAIVALDEVQVVLSQITD